MKERFNIIPIYGAESALVTEANAHFMGLCTKASHGGWERWKDQPNESVD